MKIKFTVLIFILLGIRGIAQGPDFPGIPNLTPSVNKNPASSSSSVIVNSAVLPTENISFDVKSSRRENIHSQTAKIIAEDMKKMTKDEEIRIQKENYEKAQEKENAIYNFPSLSEKSGAKSYYEAFDKLSSLDTDNYSVGEANFIVENAYFDNKKSFAKFRSHTKETVKLLKRKMSELKFDTLSNSSKNLMLFKFLSEDMNVKGKTHKALKYDFEDYMGKKDWSKTFVDKLMEKGSGQCHSMPLYYLILTEELGAEAYLSYAPNHSYVRFMDEEEQWIDVELTNGMFTGSSLILESGYIKSEALQNKIYMNNLSKKELLSQFYTDLANGYIHKYGYDNFVFKTINKALELSPNNIFANMIRANYDISRFELAMRNLGINPRDKEDLQNIRNYPKAVFLLNNANERQDKIENLGYEFMPEEAYESWLSSMKREDNKQKSEEIAERVKIINAQKQKERAEALKKSPPAKKEEKPKTNEIPKAWL
ncbi:hypothetical protein EG349_08575 [Chryseobacterium shandongense]|uniref:Transglutaminase domain-containing protein n=1 Tax=Chryseobacterium shandongense TaxID=1493872 RepID=A0AAD1DKZ1_9FLAO|nr:hypothetical protein [Chryseobacterium shandongense]AZA86837.1 hypothetical protein EG349_08575 [Chryseobacterium shandongense]AZA95253.1 hypothetical protein EG353_06625 [Chryseobacterium shandongense]